MNELINHLSIIVSHLLKWQFQPKMRGLYWICAIKEQREQANYHWKENPSLKSKLDEIMTQSYKVALIEAAKDTRLDEKSFPKECPYTFDQIMNEDFYPE